MITIKKSGDFSRTIKYLKTASEGISLADLNVFGQEGANALSSATPIDTGVTANSWSYQILVNNGVKTLTWTNGNRVNGVPIAIILQYGHATKNGGWVSGYDYINPAIKPIFDKIAAAAWKGATNK